ncbi:MAG TPA: hypothetical protein VLK34_08990 [Nocardioidaceae bacterium]|nr:hypothetical protein [Nocardioidaceae bacterium]
MNTSMRTGVAVGLAAGALLVGSPATGSIAQSHVVSEDPANFTPMVIDGGGVSHTETLALFQLGTTMYAGGTFAQVRNSAGTQTLGRSNVFSFNATTGAINSFAPNVDGIVWGITGTGNSVYIAGTFKNVNGVARRGVAKLDATTGAVDTAFNANLKGNVSEIRLVNNRLIIGGKFGPHLAALNPTTGADTGYINVPISGTVASNAGPTDVYRFAVNPAGTKLVAVGNFTSVGGRSQYRAFMLDLGTSGASLNAWNYAPLSNGCRAPSLPAYLRDVDFSPDGSYFVIVATGFIPFQGGVGRDLCDSASRFETNITNPFRPTWINYSGGDTFHSVAVTGAAVYVQGHFRALDNPNGTDGPLPGSSPRQGIGAIDPVGGKALPWNPGKTRGIGGKDFLATSAGLWVASDGARIGGELHDNIAFMPL